VAPRPLAPRQSEHGFTILEMVVAATLLAVGIFGVATVYLGTVRASSSADARSSATAVAAAEIEGLRAIPYDELGFSPADAGYVASFEGVPTVTLTAGTDQADPVAPVQIRKGISFSTVRHIVWRDATRDGVTHVQAYKQVTVLTSWEEPSGSKTAPSHPTPPSPAASST
jgi:hypothetical protein